MRAVVFVFVDLSWSHGLCAKKSRRGTAIEKKMTGGRRRRKRGAGGRARCVWWPRCDHCDCAALKSARAGSRQKVPRRALRKEPQSDFPNALWAGAAGIPFRRRREMVVILVALPIFSNGNFFCVTQPRLPVVESSRSPSNLRRCCCARQNTASTGAGAR